MFFPVAIALLVLVFYFARKAKRLAIALEKSQNLNCDLDPNNTIRALFKTSNDAIAIIDKEYTIVAANRKTQQHFESVFGKTYDIGANVLDLLAEHPQQQAQARQLWSRALSGESFTITETFEDATGERRYYEMSFSPIFGEDSSIEQALVLTREITDRARAQQALEECNDRLESRVREQTAQLTQINELLQQEIRDRTSTANQLAQQEQLFNAFFQGASVGLVILDPQLRYLQLNTVLAEIDGIPLEEHLGKTLDQVLPDLAPTLIPLYQQVIETKAPVSKVSISGETPKQPGTTCHWEASYFPLFGENRQLLGVGGVIVETSDRVRAEIALRGREKQLRLITDSLPACIAYTDGEQRYRFANKTYETWFGYRQEDIYGKTVKEVIGETGYQVVKDKIQRALSGERVTYEAEVPYQFGGTRSIRASLVPDIGENERTQGYYALIEDISARVRAERALRDNEEKFRQLVESIREVFFIYSADYQKLVYLSPAYEEIWGRSSQELYENPASWLETVHPEDREIVRDELVKQFQGQLFHREFRIVKPDGSIAWILGRTFWSREQAGETRRIVGIAEEISDRKQLEMSLHRSLQRLENLHQLDYGILAAREPSAIAEAAICNLQRLIPCQRTTIATFDFEAQTATILMTRGGGANSAGTGFQLPLPAFQPVIEQLQRGASYAISELSIFRGSAEMEALEAEKLNQFVSFPLRTEREFLGILKIWLENPDSLDSEQITIATEVGAQIAIALQQAHLSQQIQRYTAELEERVRQRTAQLQDINQELESFTYSVSHDLRAPLRALQGFATALLEDYGDRFDDLGRDYAQRLVIAAQQMEQLIQDLLNYSRISRAELRLKSVDLLATIGEAMAQLETPIERSQGQIRVEKPLAPMYGNRAILLQVIANLLSNAVKFVAPGTQPRIRLWTEVKNQRVRLWVEDNGIGIHQEYSDRIFRVFERLHGNETYPGTGIGLAIVRKGMERLGGNSGFESIPGEGSRFWIEGQLFKNKT
ncbi:MAG: PAS domain-containing protein [Cyanobacteriota bacterium]|nr:PAS domain-containing protein [Cyanobacteriota bacterium]